MTVVNERLQAFFSKYSALQYGDAHIILPAYSELPGVFYVSQGYVKQYSMTADGREFLVNIYKPGSFFPMITVMTERSNEYFYESIGKVMVHRAPVADVIHFLKNNSEVTFDLLQRVYSGVNGLLRLMTQAMAGTVRKKVIAALWMLAARFGETDGNTAVLYQAFTHSEIATIVGVSRESVTRVLSELKKEGLIQFKKRKLHFTDLDHLEKELSS